MRTKTGNLAAINQSIVVRKIKNQQDQMSKKMTQQLKLNKLDRQNNFTNLHWKWKHTIRGSLFIEVNYTLS